VWRNDAMLRKSEAFNSPASNAANKADAMIDGLGTPGRDPRI
jgi:hypothetical protein